MENITKFHIQISIIKYNSNILRNFITNLIITNTIIAKLMENITKFHIQISIIK